MPAGRFTTFPTADGLSSNFVTVIHEDRAGTLWFGTRRGLNHLVDGKFITFGKEHGLARESISAIHEDAEGVLWIGTRGGGLHRMDQGRFTSLGTSAGFFD